MIYFGTKSQQDKIEDYIDELNTMIYSNCGTQEHISLMQKKVEEAEDIKTRGYGIINLEVF